MMKMMILDCGQTFSIQWPGSIQYNQELKHPRPQSPTSVESLAMLSLWDGVDLNVLMLWETQGRVFVMLALCLDRGLRITSTWPALHSVALNLTCKRHFWGVIFKQVRVGLIGDNWNQRYEKEFLILLKLGIFYLNKKSLSYYFELNIQILSRLILDFTTLPIPKIPFFSMCVYTKISFMSDLVSGVRRFQR